MARFAYQARDGSGAMASGALTAGSLAEASKMLRTEGKIILKLQEQSGGSPAAASSSPSSTSSPAVAITARPGGSKDDVIFFANQLAVMVDTGVPLAEALDAMAAQAVNPGFKTVLNDVCEQIKAGVELSAALNRYPRIFGQLFVSMVKASEASGTMGKMLVRVSRYLEQERQVVKRVKGAMAYPVAMLSFCILVVVAMLLFVLPRFEKIYAGKAAALPAPTKILLALSHGLADYWPFVLGGLVALVAGLWWFSRQSQGKATFDLVRLRMPLLGPMFRKACLARSLRTLATMLATGVSVLESLEITSEVAGNSQYAKMWKDLAERLTSGAALSEEMRKMPLLPPAVAQMVSAGERSGRLAMVLDRVAGFCEEDLDTSIRTATSFIEPVMIVIMGVLVGGIAMALLLPVFSLSKVVAR